MAAASNATSASSRRACSRRAAIKRDPTGTKLRIASSTAGQKTKTPGVHVAPRAIPARGQRRRAHHESPRASLSVHFSSRLPGDRVVPLSLQLSTFLRRRVDDTTSGVDGYANGDDQPRPRPVPSVVALVQLGSERDGQQWKIVSINRVPPSGVHGTLPSGARWPEAASLVSGLVPAS